MELSYKEKFSVKFHEGDFKGNVKLFTIMDYIQQVAEGHAQILGVDFKSMMDHGLFWVVSRIEITMERYPKVGEDITVETYLGGREKVFMKRRFKIEDKDGQVIGRALIYYLILDTKTRFPQKPSVCPVDIDINVGNVIDNKLNKIKMPGEAIETIKRELYYNDIDINNHVNNARYISFIEDFFSLDWHREKNISYMQLNFIKEIKFDDILIMNKFIENKENNSYCINGISGISKQEFFQCKLKF
ncbi:acyl-ACP thioesterase domain-containing protein [Clostridium sp. UBA1056]|uniref:acyl-[acyl-carrier-protein] thioesterase n=1 Tax=unclassified Clostridium TaxID=2614128 RepID=UPI00321627B1